MENETTNSAIKLINADGLVPPLGHYSHVSLAGGTAYISGQLPLNAGGTPVTDQPFDVQVRQTLSNLDDCLSTLSLSRGSIAQVRVYITDIAKWKRFDEIYSEWIGTHRPARAVAGVSELHYGAGIEIEAVAVL